MSKSKLFKDKLEAENVMLYYYHSLLYSFMKESDFTPDNKTLELFCQVNPGYNILTDVDENEKSVLVRLHKDHLEDFYKFSMINRLGEIVQNYVEKVFILPKNVNPINDYNSALYKLKNLKYEDLEVRGLPLITSTNYNYIERFMDFAHKSFFMNDSQMGEIFDNFCFDIYSSFNIQLATRMNSYKSDTLLEIKKENYIALIKWLVEHCEDSYSDSQRSSGRFYQLLMVFIWIHHVEMLIGLKEPHGNKVTWRSENAIIDDDPLFFLKNPTAKIDDDCKWISYATWFQSREGRITYQRMLLHGNLNPCNCICSKCGIMPNKNDKRIYDNQIVSFLTLQNKLYSPLKPRNSEEPEVVGY